jgi:hypothetical protein
LLLLIEPFRLGLQLRKEISKAIMDEHYPNYEIDWNLILQQMQIKLGQDLPTFPGDLKTALLNHAGLADDATGEAAYQLAVEISRTSTFCDPEITYWFARLVALLHLQSQTSFPNRLGLPVYLGSVSTPS